MPKKSIPKKNTISSKRRRIAASLKQQQTQTTDEYQSLKQENGKTDTEFSEHQQTALEQKQEQNRRKPQKSGPVEHGKKYANLQTDKAKDYGTQKEKETRNEGADHAKEKDFLDKNQKAADTLAKSKQIKEDFENRMGLLMESAELNAQKPPIQPMPGESDAAFLKRQREADKNTSENPKKMSLKDAAVQHGKDYGKKQFKKGTDFAMRKGKDFLAKNPKAAKIANAAIKAKEKAAAFEKRRQEIMKKVAEKNKKITNRIKALKEFQKKLSLKKLAEDKLKELAMQIAKAAARFILQVIVSVASAFSETIAIILGIAILVVIIYAAFDYACNNNVITEAFCSTIINAL